MSKWAGKYIIGLTGNIGTGKSMVRKMLERLGAYGIDADALAHRAIGKGSPGFQPVLDAFGSWLLGSDGEIDRGKLAKVAFSEPDALQKLEQIIHPLVIQATDYLVRRASQQVIVIEAIKLIESGMGSFCDSIWVTYAPKDIQLSRLVQIRKMSELEANKRIDAQPPQEQKLASAGVIIRNETTIEETWRQVTAAWEKISQFPDSGQATLVFRRPPSPENVEVNVLRGKPRHVAEIADFINRIGPSGQNYRASDIMTAYGEKAYLLLQVDKKLMGLIGWQVENLVVRILDIFLDPQVSAIESLPVLINEMERLSQDLQCEASLAFVPKDFQHLDGMWGKLGYERKDIDGLGVQAWQEAAQESLQPRTALYFKQLRQERILRPI